MTQSQRDIRRKLKVLRYAEEIGNVSKACRYFGISREPYYCWKRALANKGEAGLVNSKPYPENPKLRTPQKIEEKILYLRLTYHFGQQRISWYLKRYAQFHWHFEDLGMRHVYIKPRTPKLNGKVERSHRTDKDEFYQLLSFTDDVDLNQN